MIKNAVIYTLNKLDITEDIESYFSDLDFTPCMPTESSKSGWVEPNGERFFETVNGQHIVKLMTETKKVPADVVDRKLQAAVKQIEVETGRKPGKKERKEMKDNIILELLPSAFPSRQSSLVWIDPDNMTIVVDASTKKKADDVITFLVKTIPGIEVSGFGIDRDCVLAAEDATKVKYVNHDLYIDEVVEHIKSGMQVQSLSMTWDKQVSFALSDSAILKKIEFIDIEDDGSFESSAALMIGMMQPVIVDLNQALS